jgi:hypothetical protein
MSIGFLVGILLQLQLAKWLLINRWLLRKRVRTMLRLKLWLKMLLLELMSCTSMGYLPELLL